MKVHADISLVCFHECTIWSYLQVRYILLREAYIANTRNDTSWTSGDSDKCNNFIQVHIQGNEWCGRPPPPTHAHAHARTTHTHMNSYVDETFSSLPGPCSAFCHFQYIQETKCSMRAGLHQLFIKLKGAKSTQLFWCSIAMSHKLRILILNCQM